MSTGTASVGTRVRLLVTVARLGHEPQVGHLAHDVRAPLLVGVKDGGVYAPVTNATWDRS